MKCKMIWAQIALGLLVSFGLLTACNSGEKKETKMNETVYTVREIAKQNVTLENAFPAVLKGTLDVEIRPQVGGQIMRVAVDEGDRVKKGQTLFVLDQVQFQEAVNVAQSAVDVAVARVATAQLSYDNNKSLAEENIIGDFVLQTSENNLATAKAGLAQARAQLASAQKQLSFANIVSPTDGIVGNIPYRVGSLASPSTPTPLTVVSDIDEMYAHFSITERQLLAMSHEEESMTNMLSHFPPLSLRLLDGSIYPHKGKLETISGVLDPATGSVNVRVLFPNPGEKLRSGSKGQVIIPTELKDVIEIPQAATFSLQHKQFVYVVEDGIAKSREIEVLPGNDGVNYVVTSGLSEGDMIVVNGVVTLRDGMPIQVKKEEL